MKKKHFNIAGLLAILVVILSACNLNAIRGSGDLITETRNVSNFDGISLSGSGTVIITQTGEESLVVETDDNLMEYVTTEVRGGTLELGFDSVRGRPISPTRLTFTLNVDDLTGLDILDSGDIEIENLETDRLEIGVSGSGDIQIDSLTADTLDIQISGSGNIDLAGAVTGQEIDISGSGNYRAGNLRSETVTIDISDSGDAIVWAINSLDADIGGSGTIDYYGTPAVTSSTSGSGNINSLGEKG